MKQIAITLSLIVTLFFTACTNEGSKTTSKVQKVFFANDFKDEKSELQPFQKWYSGSSDNKYTLEELYKDGWKISNIIKVNASASNWQMNFFMEISEEKYEKIKYKYKTIKKSVLIYSVFFLIFIILFFYFIYFFGFVNYVL